MNRRTLARRNALMTFAAQPWTLFADDPATGGGGNAPKLNEHGFPDATPVVDMAPEHQAAYWKHHARKHEQRANAAPDAAELETLRSAAAELAERKKAELTDAERIQAEKTAADDARTVAERERDEARAELLRVRVAADKGLTVEQAARLRGSTKEELEADADELKKLFTPSAGDGNQGGAHRSGGARGSDVGGSAPSVSTGEELYRQRNPRKN
ncbi:hypothetical protein ACFVZM_06815 [Streptomyces sioyaensis]|uniref:hypothetical protein n=1 Tax=Streptomyces sioyaensis TaxID=67364 RepID=UPI0036C427DA